MAINERDRQNLFERLDGVLGADNAEHLMELLPPVGWADVATKDDVHHCRDVLQTEIRTVESRLSGHLGQLRDEHTALRLELKGDIKQLRAELEGEIGQLRTEMTANTHQLRTEMTANTDQLRAGTDQLRLEMVTLGKELRAEMATGLTKVQLALQDRLDTQYRTMMLAQVSYVLAVVAIVVTLR